MTCHEDQGTANPNARWPFEDAGNNAATSGYLQVVPEEFTREELQALRNKAKSQLDWNAEGIRADLLEDLVETLDLLDALEARDEADLAGLEEKMRDNPHYVPLIEVEPRMPGPLPSCGPDCPFHPRLYR